MPTEAPRCLFLPELGALATEGGDLGLLLLRLREEKGAGKQKQQQANDRDEQEQAETVGEDRVGGGG